MTRTLWRSSLRHLLRHPWQFGLSVLGVALGVAVVLSIDLANASATRAFEIATEAVSGRATHQVVGGPRGLPEELYSRLRIGLGLRLTAPVVSGHLVPADAPGRALRLFGVDPFAEAPFRAYFAGSDADLELGPLLTRPGAFLCTAETARSLGLEPGDTLRALVGARERTLLLVGHVRPGAARAREALRDLLVVDVATAQELLGLEGRLTRIDLVLQETSRRSGAPPSAAPADGVARVRDVLPPGSELITAGSRADSTLQMTRAFRTNLTALSLLALVCGMFLIYNTMTFSVVQRRALIGTLRAVGVTRDAVLRLVLSEALIVGILGTSLGMLGGIGLARGLLGLVTRTINDLYFVLSVSQLATPHVSLAKAALLGVGATLLAAVPPAREATSSPASAVLARSALESGVRRAVPRAAAAGSALLAVGFTLLTASDALVPSFAALLVTILGFALLTPVAVVALMRVLEPPLRRLLGTLGRLAAGGVVATLSRTAVAIAALMIAVSVIVGVGVMIDSFRRTVVDWLDTTLRADLYVSPPGRPGTRADLILDDRTLARLRNLPGVDRVDTIRRVTLPSADGGVRLVAYDLADDRPGGFLWKAGDPRAIWQAFENGGVIVTEPFAYRRELDVGDRLRLPTDRGPHDFPVVAVHYDYSSDRGVVGMADQVYRRWFDDPAISGFSVHLEEGTDPDALERRIRLLLDDTALTIRSNRALRETSLEIFDRTFLITGVLRALVTLVAFIGVLSALMALQLERARELGVLRAIGMTPGQLWALVTSQSGLMGLASGLLAVPVGLVLAAIMIFVINRRSFGWTLQMELGPWILVQAVLLAVLAALLAAVYPAARLARTPTSEALREE